MEVCRTCMNAGAKPLVPVYSKLEDVFIANIIMECTSLQIRENDGLPAHICNKCVNTLKLLTSFIQTARDCDRQLRKICKVEKLGTSTTATHGGAGLVSDEECNLEPQESPTKTEMLDQDSDIFQFAEVKIEAITEGALLAETGEQSESEAESNSEDEDGRDFSAGSDSSSSDSNSDSDFEEESLTLELKPAPKKRGRKPKPKPANTDDKPLLNKRRHKPDEDLSMTEYEKELYTEIVVEPGKSVCCGCLWIYDTPQELETHRNKVHIRKREKKSFRPQTKVLCDGCLRKYNSKRRVNYHKERIRQLEVIWECNKCKNRFHEVSRRRSHAKKHPQKQSSSVVVAPIKEFIQKELGWLCCAQACGQSFPSEAELLGHARKAHQINKQEAELEENRDKSFQCRVCYRKFNEKSGLINHQQRLYKLQKYQCALCGLQFITAARLTEHELTHKDEKPFKCTVCSKSFTQKGNLKTHMTIHTDEKPFQCTVCGISFRQKGGLKAHMSNHIEKPQFKCEVCSKMFKAKLHLRYHMRTHNGERPFPCRYCEKAFGDFTNRMRHEMSHTGIKPYKCSYCDKTFIRKRFQVEHETTHTGIKLYNCEVCHQSFSQKNSWKKHMQFTHPGHQPGEATSGGPALAPVGTTKTSSLVIEPVLMSPGSSIISDNSEPMHPLALSNQQQHHLLAGFPHTVKSYYDDKSDL
ncbi:zinc finger protein 436-like [Uranotaenia lowii]|uniref:zinc finger protein 436-like n=1 Tax=Uranotaenia lowii TaxID=190385 RepID=UPI00247A8C2F|nr:zinc finger protein 436-like [Uranotaenia lowii]